MLVKDVRALLEAYGEIYSDNGNQQRLIDEEIDSVIEEVVEELVEECVNLGYTLDEALETIEESAIEYLAELNPYAPAGSKESRAYNKATTSTKHKEAHKAAVKAAVNKVRAKAAGAAVSAYAAGKAAKDAVGSAANTIGSGAQRAAGAVSTAAQDAKNRIKGGIKKALGGGLRAVANKAGKVASRLGEETNIFDTVLEFLQAEGFAETLEEAEWMMANVIDEEAIEIILGEEELDEAITSEKGKAKAAEMIAKRSTPSGRAKPGQGASVSQIKHISRSNREGLGLTPATRSTSGSNRPKSYSGMGGTGNKAARRAGLTPTREKPNAWKEEYMDEAQSARENPEKYEREQSKKYAPVRGEKTPMPPRGDKRREDFEKWYAANVR